MLGEQTHLDLGKPTAGLDQVRPAFDRAMERGGPPPALDGGMVAAAQHLGNHPTAELRRSRVLRILEQPRREALVLGRNDVADDAGDEARDGLDDRERGELPPARTKSPIEISPSTRWSAMRWSTPS